MQSNLAAVVQRLQRHQQQQQDRPQQQQQQTKTIGRAPISGGRLPLHKLASSSTPHPPRPMPPPVVPPAPTRVAPPRPPAPVAEKRRPDSNTSDILTISAAVHTEPEILSPVERVVGAVVAATTSSSAGASSTLSATLTTGALPALSSIVIAGVSTCVPNATSSHTSTVSALSQRPISSTSENHPVGHPSSHTGTSTTTVAAAAPPATCSAPSPAIIPPPRSSLVPPPPPKSSKANDPAPPPPLAPSCPKDPAACVSAVSNERRITRSMSKSSENVTEEVRSDSKRSKSLSKSTEDEKGEKAKSSKRKSKSLSECSAETVELMQELAPKVVNKVQIEEMQEMTKRRQERMRAERIAEEYATKVRERKKKAELAKIAEEEAEEVERKKAVERSPEKEKDVSLKKNTKGKEGKGLKGVEGKSAKRKVSPASAAAGSRGVASKFKRLADRGLAAAAAGTMVVASAAAGKITPNSSFTKSRTPSPLGNLEIGSFLDSGSDVGEQEKEEANKEKDANKKDKGEKRDSSAAHTRTHKKKEFDCCNDNQPKKPF